MQMLLSVAVSRKKWTPSQAEHWAAGRQWVNRTCTAIASLTTPTGPRISNKQRRENRRGSVTVKSLSAKSNLKQKCYELSSWEGAPFSTVLGWGRRVKDTLQEREDGLSVFQAASSSPPRGPRRSRIFQLSGPTVRAPHSFQQSRTQRNLVRMGLYPPRNGATTLSWSPCPHALGDAPGNWLRMPAGGCSLVFGIFVPLSADLRDQPLQGQPCHPTLFGD